MATAYQMPLSQLLDDSSLPQEVVVTGLQLDSRRVVGGDLFLAVAGEVHDGRQFIEQAAANGASAVLAEAPVAGFVEALPVPLVEWPDLRAEIGEVAARFYRYPSRDMALFGITGTNGKTTVSRLVAQLQRSRGNTCGVIGTLGATLEDTVVEAGNTTPDAVSLQGQLAQWRDAGVASVAMEVSSHALVQGRVAGAVFDTAVFTNLSHDHLDYHGTMAAYGRAKLTLFQLPGLQHAVVNLDDDYAAVVCAAVAAGVRVVTYSGAGNSAADVCLTVLEPQDGGFRVRLSSPWGDAELYSPLPGDFNLANVAAAFTCAMLHGAELEATLAAVSRLQSVPGRMELVPNDSGVQVVVDYAHTPDALEQALRALRSQVAGELIVVFGCGGDRDAQKRPVMGHVAERYADRLVITSDNPRSENSLTILEDIKAGCSGEPVLEVDRRAAIELAIATARTGDCVLIAGKGHEDYQLVDGERLTFCDVTEAAAALARRAHS